MRDTAIQSAIDACQRCAQACMDFSAQSVNRDHRFIVLICSDCSSVCQATAGMLRCRSSIMHLHANFCAEVCDACAAECDRHDLPESSSCAKACRACAAECRAAADVIADAAGIGRDRLSPSAPRGSAKADGAESPGPSQYLSL